MLPLPCWPSLFLSWQLNFFVFWDLEVIVFWNDHPVLSACSISAFRYSWWKRRSNFSPAFTLAHVHYFQHLSFECRKALSFSSVGSLRKILWLEDFRSLPLPQGSFHQFSFSGLKTLEMLNLPLFWRFQQFAVVFFQWWLRSRTLLLTSF